AAADDGDIGGPRQIGERLAPRRPGFPPIGERLEVRMEDAVAALPHATQRSRLPRTVTNSSKAAQSASVSAAPIGSDRLIIPRRATQMPRSTMSKKKRPRRSGSASLAS